MYLFKANIGLFGSSSHGKSKIFQYLAFVPLRATLAKAREPVCISLFVCLVNFLTSLSTTRLYRGLECALHILMLLSIQNLFDRYVIMIITIMVMLMQMMIIKSRREMIFLIIMMIT